jgi:hypothetical protein
MSASINPIHALVARLNARRNITCADVATLIDMLIEQEFSEYVRDMRRHGLSADEIETSIEIQTEMAREWRAQVLREVSQTFFSTKGNAPTSPTVQ